MGRAVITGGEGFVGRHLRHALLRQGWDVLSVDVRHGGDDALDFFRLNDADYDLLIHCAALVGGRAKIDGDPLAIATNLALDSWAFRWATKHAGRMVYFSSSAAYPVELQTRDHPHRQLTEADINLGSPARPDATYGLAKLTGEMLASEAEAAGLPVHVFRPFSGYGSDQDLDYPFPSFIRRAARREDPFQVWGDGTQARDFIHIHDVVGAVLAALDEDFRDPVNLCTGLSTTFLELAAACLRLSGSNASVEALVDKPVGCWRRVGDPRLMQTFYSPTISLDDGIRMALARREGGFDCR